MARREARLLVEIWEDTDFLKLSPLAQRAYMFLLSQPDLAHTGVIPLRERRWAKKTSDLSADMLAGNLRELEDCRFLVVDWDAEEVLVRSFIRRDRVFKQPNVMRAAVDHVPLIESKAILRSLITEMDRIRQENPELTALQDEVLSEMENALVTKVGPEIEASPERPTGNPSTHPSGNPYAHPSANATPATPGERGMVTVVSKSFPEPRTPGPAPPSVASLPTVVARKREKRVGTRVPENFAVTEALAKWASKEAPAVNLARETANFLDHWRASDLQSAIKRDWVAAWRTWMRKAQGFAERDRARASPHQLALEPGYFAPLPRSP